MKILAVNHGEKRIGLAISDPTGTLARPLAVFEHSARLVDAARVAQTAAEEGAERIVVGQSFDEDGLPNLAGRRAARFAESLRTQTCLPVELWDEAFTTQDVRRARIEMGGSRRQRSGHMDAAAAAFLLQSYLDANLQT